MTDAGPLPLPRADTRGRTSSSAVAGRRSGTRQCALDVVHLIVLWSLAVAQPLFDVLSRGASFFAARGSSRAEILLFVLGLVLVPALTLAVGELVVWIALGRRVRLLVHGSLVALLLALIAIQLLQRTALSSTDALIGIPAALGVAGAIAYFRFPAARSVVTVLSPAPVLFAALFLLHSPVSTLILPGSDHTASARVASGPPIVFVVFDEFSVGSLMDDSLRVDPVRYPNFARLASTSTWFRNDATTNLGTDQAVPALLTGRFVSRDELPVLRDHPDNLFTLLERTYRMNVHETLTRLCPKRSCPRRTSVDDASGRIESLVSDVSVVYGHIVLPERLADRLPSISTTWGDFRGAELDGRALTQESAFDDFVDSIGPAARPTLNFLHVEVPHVPWRYLPSGRRYDVPGLAVPGLQNNDTWGRQSSLVRQGQQRYLLQVGFVDRLLGRLMSKLRRSGLFDRAILVVTADHGVSFHAGEGRRTTYRNREDLAFVPLFVKLPNQRTGRVVDRVVQSIDVLPTIADAAGIEVPWRHDGRSALGSRDLRRVSVEGASFDAADLVARRDQAVRAQAKVFGARQGWDRVLGTPSELLHVGQDPREVASAEFADLHAIVADEDRLRVVAPGGSTAPSLISGTVGGSDAAPGIELVIAANGRIAGFGTTFRDGGAIAFSALISETQLRAGSNAVEILAVDRRPQGALVQTIARVGGEQASTYRLVGATIKSTDGRAFRVVPGAVQGMLDAVEIAGGEARFTGWAGSLGARRPRDNVIVFSNDRFVYSFSTLQRGSRPDLPKGLEDSGFSFAVPSSLLGQRPSLRVFGVIGDRASELTPPPAYTRSANR